MPTLTSCRYYTLKKIILLHTLKIKIIIPIGTPRKWEFFFVVKITTTLSVKSLDYAISLC